MKLELHDKVTWNVLIGSILGIVGGIIVLVGLSTDFYRDTGTAWQLMEDSGFRYLYWAVGSAFVSIFISILTLFRPHRLYLFVLFLCGIGSSSFSILAWNHGYYYLASIVGGTYEQAFTALGLGFGWLIASIGGIFIFFSYYQLKNTEMFEELKIGNKPIQQKYEKESEGGFCPYCGTDNPPEFNYCDGCQKRLPL